MLVSFVHFGLCHIFCGGGGFHYIFLSCKFVLHSVDQTCTIFNFLSISHMTNHHNPEDSLCSLNRVFVRPVSLRGVDR